MTDLDDLTIDRREQILPKCFVLFAVGTSVLVEIDAVGQLPIVRKGAILALRTVPVVTVLERHEDEWAGIRLTTEAANPKEKGNHNCDLSVSHPDLLARLSVPV